MATHTVTHLVDDIDGNAADETISFTIDNARYEIDLSQQNAANFRKAMREYVDHARRVGGPVAKQQFTGVDVAAVRAWAQSRHITVKTRGRLSADVIAQYRAAGN